MLVFAVPVDRIKLSTSAFAVPARPGKRLRETYAIICYRASHAGPGILLNLKNRDGKICYHSNEHDETARRRKRCQEPYSEHLMGMAWVNAEEGAEALRRIRQSVVRGQPFGPTEWVVTMIERFGLASTVRSEGRPKKTHVENGS